MKTHVIMIAAAFLLGTMSFAQGAGPRGGAAGGPGPGGKGVRGQGGPGRGMGMQKQVFEKLGLSAAQKTQLEKVSKAHGDKLKAMREKNQGKTTKPNMETWRAESKKMRDAYMADVKKILTPAQYKKMQDLMAAERAKFEKNRTAAGAGKAGGKGGKIKP